MLPASDSTKTCHSSCVMGGTTGSMVICTSRLAPAGLTGTFTCNTPSLPTRDLRAMRFISTPSSCRLYPPQAHAAMISVASHMRRVPGLRGSGQVGGRAETRRPSCQLLRDAHLAASFTRKTGRKRAVVVAHVTRVADADRILAER